MAETRQLDDKKREDRALALLSLAAERPEPPGACPAESELARLVDGRVTAEERSRLQHHLSLCHGCYRQWLALTRAAGRPGERGRLVRPGRFRRAGYLGTALALAASVAVFLNIRYEAGLAPPGEPAGQIQLREAREAAPKNETAAPATAEPQPTAAAPARPAAPAPAPTAEKAKKERAPVKPAERVPVKPAAPAKGVLPAVPPPPAVQDTSGADRLVQKQDKTAEQPEQGMSAEPAAPAEQAAPAESASRPARAALARQVTDADRWLDRVREGCRSGRPDPAFWLALQAEGEELHRRLQAQKSDVSRIAKVAAILPLLAPLTDAGLDDDKLIGQCRLLRDELGKEEAGAAN